MRILVTNDDGIHAPGLATLEEIARELSDDVWVVAPESDQSGVSHSLSLNDPLRLRQAGEALRGEGHALRLRDPRHPPHPGGEGPDLVLSGVNRGQNVAEDVTYSGTIAAAMEGTILGVRSIALSQAYGAGGRQALKWDCARTHGAKVVRKILDTGIEPGILVNVNFPDCEPGRCRASPWPRRASAIRRCSPSTPASTGAATRISGSPSPRRGSSRPRLGFEGHRGEAHLGDAAAPRPHRRADAHPLRPGLRGMTTARDEAGSIGDAAFVLALREKGLRDIAVLRAMERVPRGTFAPEAHREQARWDIALPLPCGATMTAPSSVAAMLTRLKLEPGQRVMEIGAGSGYVTALLDRLGRARC